MNIYLFNLIHNLSNYNFVNYFSFFVSYIFTYLIPIFLVVWVIYRQKRKVFSIAILSFSALSTWLLTTVIKSLTAVARPIVANPLVVESDFSFPSGHASVTMAVAIIVYALDRKIGAYFIVASILVGLSRIILGVHFPSDVLAGWLLGGIVGLAFIKLFKNR